MSCPWMNSWFCFRSTQDANHSLCPSLTTQASHMTVNTTRSHWQRDTRWHAGTQVSMENGVFAEDVLAPGPQWSCCIFSFWKSFFTLPWNDILALLRIEPYPPDVTERLQRTVAPKCQVVSCGMALFASLSKTCSFPLFPGLPCALHKCTCVNGFLFVRQTYHWFHSETAMWLQCVTSAGVPRDYFPAGSGIMQKIFEDTSLTCHFIAENGTPGCWDADYKGWSSKQTPRHHEGCVPPPPPENWIFLRQIWLTEILSLRSWAGMEWLSEAPHLAALECV